MSNAVAGLNCNVQKVQIAIRLEMCCNYKNSHGESIIFPGALNG